MQKSISSGNYSYHKKWWTKQNREVSSWIPSGEVKGTVGLIPITTRRTKHNYPLPHYTWRSSNRHRCEKMLRQHPSEPHVASVLQRSNGYISHELPKQSTARTQVFTSNWEWDIANLKWEFRTKPFLRNGTGILRWDNRMGYNPWQDRRIIIKENNGIIFNRHLGGKWEAALWAFIDDVKLYHKGDRTEITEQLQTLASQKLQLWNNIL